MQQLAITIFCIFTYFLCGNTQNTTTDVSIILTRAALDYILGQTQQLLNKQLVQMEMPGAGQDIENGRVEITNVKLTKFQPPSYYYDLEPPSTLIWGLNDASLAVEGQWAGSKMMMIPLKGSGGFQADLSQLSLFLKARLGKSASGTATVEEFTCNASIASLQTRATGGVMGYVLNIFRDTVSDKVKPILEQEICAHMTQMMDEDLSQDLLQKMPLTFELGRNFDVALRLADAPRVDKQAGYIQLNQNLDVLYQNQSEAPKYQMALKSTGQPGPLPQPMNRMVYIRVHQDAINKIIYSFHAEDMSSYVVDEQSNPDMAGYLRVSCQPSENCLGNSLAGLGDAYPVGSKGAFRVYSRQAPTVNFNDNTLEVNAPGVLELTIRTGPPSYAEDLLLTADVDLGAIVHAAVSSDGKKVTGDLSVTRFELKVKDGLASLVSVDEKKLANSLRGFVADYGNKALATGMDLPMKDLAPGFGLKNVALKFVSKALQLEADMDNTMLL